MPTWRANDTFREVDLIEEVSRIDGIWKVPTVMPPHADAIGKRDPEVRLRNRVMEDQVAEWIADHARVSDEQLSFDQVMKPQG